MNSIDKLTEIFSHFPGIGPRQAKRFVYFLLSKNNAFSDELIRAVEGMKKEITQCSECLRYFPKTNYTGSICSICSDVSRDSKMLMIVPRDIDLEAVERSGSYKGYYFVLGGSLPILEKEPERRIRVREFIDRVTKRAGAGLEEIILAMNANSEGENTTDYLKEKIQALPLDKVTISILGRGLSTGAELEYADPDTLTNAFLHRTK